MGCPTIWIHGVSSAAKDEPGDLPNSLFEAATKQPLTNEMQVIVTKHITDPFEQAKLRLRLHLSECRAVFEGDFHISRMRTYLRRFVIGHTRIKNSHTQNMTGS